MNKEKKVYLWNNVAVYKTFQEAWDKRKEYLNEDTMAQLDVKISKQAKGFVVKVRTFTIISINWQSTISKPMF